MAGAGARVPLELPQDGRSLGRPEAGAAASKGAAGAKEAPWGLSASRSTSEELAVCPQGCLDQARSCWVPTALSSSLSWLCLLPTGPSWPGDHHPHLRWGSLRFHSVLGGLQVIQLGEKGNKTH